MIIHSLAAEKCSKSYKLEDIALALVGVAICIISSILALGQVVKRKNVQA